MWKTSSKFIRMKERKERRVFSESFKREKVKLIESGQVTIYQLSKLLELGEASLYRWVEKYGTSDVRQPRIVIETESDYLKLVKLEKQLNSLQQVIGKLHIKLDYYEELIKATNEHYKIDLEKQFLKK